MLSACKALTTRKGHAASVRRQSRQRLRSERRYIFSRAAALCRERCCSHVKLSAFHFQLSICRTPCYNVHLAAYIPFSMTEF